METISIGAVERETGVTRDLLRMWERRYQFPQPSRDARGDRVYTRQQVEVLRLIKRLIDQGHRPGSVVGRSRAALMAMLQQPAPPTTEPQQPMAKMVAMVRDGRVPTLRALLQRKLRALGVFKFLDEVLTPLNVEVGNAWAAGKLPVYQEHLYSESVQGLLRDAIGGMAAAKRRPRTLLTTLPDEQHGLGLLMVQCLFRSSGVETVSLGTQTPVEDIVKAAKFHRVDVVALSLSSAFPRSLIEREVVLLRLLLPAEFEIWLGGEGLQRIRGDLAGTRSARSLKDAMELVETWSPQR